MALETELATYQAHLPELLANTGRFVLIHGNEIEDFFSSYDDALKAGYQRFQLQPFLVKQVAAVEKVLCITRQLHAVSTRATV